MQIRRFDTEDRFDALADVWRGLTAGAAASPFQTFAWCREWWRHVGRHQPSLSLELLLAVEDGRPLALAPLALDRRQGELCFLGDPWVDYSDMLAVPGSAGAAALGALTAAICDGLEAGRYDHVRLAEIPEESRLLHDGGTGFDRRPASVCPFRDFAVGGAESAPAREYIIKRRRLERIGAVRLIEHRQAAAISDRLPAFFAMHLAQWGQRAGALTFEDPDMRAFYAGSVASLAAAEMISLWELRLGDAALAFYYGYRSRAAWFGYRPAYSGEWHKLSPGGVMHLMMFEALAAGGVDRFDFMRGDEAYKARFATGCRRNVTLSGGRR